MKLLSVVKAKDGIHKLEATFQKDNGRTKTTTNVQIIWHKEFMEFVDTYGLPNGYFKPDNF